MWWCWTRELPDRGLKRGDLGSVVDVYAPDGVEVKFVTASGRTEALVTLNIADVRPILLVRPTRIEDVAAFMDTCRLVRIPAAVERSGSGNGAHVWFFFSEPVPAAAARRMGCYLKTETMSRRHDRRHRLH